MATEQKTRYTQAQDSLNNLKLLDNEPWSSATSNTFAKSLDQASQKDPNSYN